MQMKKRCLAMILSILMLVSMLPATAMAEEPISEGETPVHEHSYSAVITKPTCTEKGYTTYTCACGDSYVADETEALNHPETVVLEGYDADCVNAGLTDGLQCALCGEILQAQEEIPAWGHQAVHVEEVPATESSAGTTAGSVCSVCGEVLEGLEEIPMLTPEPETAEPTEASLETQNEPEGPADTAGQSETANPQEEIRTQTTEATVDTASAEKTRVSFTLTPEDAKLTVYTKGNPEDPEEKTEIDAEEDGTYLLSPGQYFYDLEAEAYVAVEEEALEVTASDEPLEVILEMMPEKEPEAQATGKGTETAEPVTTVTASGETVAAEAKNSLIANGTCGANGDNLTWTLDEDGVLTISGTGAMKEFTASTEAPWKSYLESIQTVILQDGVTSIGSEAFMGCSNLVSAGIPNSVTSIGINGFHECSSLVNLTIPDSVTNIGAQAFTKCSNLTSVNIPYGVTTIGMHTFAYCSQLRSIAIPNSVTDIRPFAFQYCYGLAEVSIPNSVTSIGSHAFEATAISEVTLPSNLTTIDSSAFSDCSNLSSVSIPASVTSIDLYAFYHCTSLTDVTIPVSVTTIAKYAFQGADALKDVYYKGTPAQWSAVQIGDYNEPLQSASIHFSELSTPVLTGASNVSGGVKITWNAVTGAEKYRVFRKTGSSGWAILADATATSYTDGTVVGGTKYTYTVRCISSDGQTYTSGYDTAGVTITYNIPAPVISSVNGVNGGVEIKWAKENGAVKYRVFRKTGSGDWTKLADTTTLSYTDKTAKAGTTYSYTVRCVTSDGKTYTSSYDSAGKSIKYAAVPKLSKTSNVYGGVKISWEKASGAVKYRVFRKTGSGGWAALGDTTSLSYKDKTAVSGTKYVYTVRTVTSDGKAFTGGYDTTGKTRTYIAAPEISNLSAVSGGIKVTWGKVTGAAKYRVFRKAPGNTSWKKLGDTKETTYTDKTAKAGTKYSYTVRCLTKDGNNFTSGYNSTGKSITVPYYSLANPGITGVTGGNDGVTVSWGKVSGAAKYRLFRKGPGDTSWKAVGDTTGTSMTDKGVKGKTGKTYTYTVRCISSDGKSFTSGFDSKGRSILYAAAPTIAGTLNRNGIQVTWKSVSGVSKYRLYRKTGTESWKAIKDVNGVVYTDTDVSPNKTYTYTVRCLSSDNTLISGYDTNGKTGKATLPITDPPVLTAVENVVVNGKACIRLNWTAVPGAAQYRVYKQTGSSDFFGETKPTKGTSYTDENVTAGVKYTYYICCQNSDAITISNSSNRLSITAAGQNSGLTLTSVNNVATGVRITWNAVSGASKYKVAKGVPNSSGGTTWATIPSAVSGTSYLDEEVTNGSSYSYYVYGVDSSGNKVGSNSNPLSIKYQYAAATPTLTGISVKDGKVTITWKAVGGIAKYRVFRKTGNGAYAGIDFATGTSYTSPKLSSGTYTYSIGCINSINNNVSGYNQTGKTVTIP